MKVIEEYMGELGYVVEPIFSTFPPANITKHTRVCSYGNPNRAVKLRLEEQRLEIFFFLKSAVHNWTEYGTHTVDLAHPDALEEIAIVLRKAFSRD